MAKFCLIPKQVQEFKLALKNGEIDPFKMADMTSAERRTFLAKYVGQENAQQVNALFESKLLLKRQVQGYKTWVKKVSGISKETKRDLISRIERMDKVLTSGEERAFLEDLAAQRLGFGVSQQEAESIFNLSTKLSDLRARIGEDFTPKTKSARMEYGATRQALEKYTANLKSKTKPGDFRLSLSPSATAQNIKGTVKFIAQNSRAFVASFDNSLWGNQGARVALDPRYFTIWAKNFAKSFKDITQTLVQGKKKGDEILDAVKAEVYSRKNSLNGRYEMSTPETSKLDIGIVEEEFPTSLPSKIPVLGRFFKAAEVAYEAGAIRLRADIADKIYDMAEKSGINLLDKFEVGSRNTVINSLTGRGRVTHIPDIINDAMFSVKFTRSQLDVLTLGQSYKLSSSARKLAAGNVLRTLASTAVILGISQALDPNSVEFDPRSTRFGKIEKDGIQLVNLMPGYGSMMTLMSRILTQTTKNRAGVERKLGEGYGVPNGMDIFWDFTENKASPIASIIRDLVRQKTFEGDKPTPGTLFKESITSISLDNTQKILADKSGDSLLKAIAVGLSIIGTGAGSTFYEDKWENKTTAEMEQFKEQVGDTKFKEANDRFNNTYQKWLKDTQKSTDYQNLTSDEKEDLISKAKTEIKNQVFDEYKFKPKKSKPKPKNKTIDSLLP